MKQRYVVLMVAILAVGLCVPHAFAQGTTSVKGTCKDMDGKPYADAVVEFTSAESGHKYTLKTNKKGEYFSLGVAGGQYDVSLKVDGKEVYRLNKVPVTLQTDENVIDIDLKKEQAAGQQQMSEEDKKKLQEAQEKAQKESMTVKQLNDKLAGARAARAAAGVAMTAGNAPEAIKNYDQAIQIMTEASQLDATRDLVWYELAEGLRGKARATEKSDRAAAKDLYKQAADAYQKAIAIKPMPPYYNNLADAYSRGGSVDDAVKAYTQAAALDPTGAAQYQYNIGAVYTNAGRIEDAVTAFKATIAADPTKADAYYQLGVNLVGKATTDKNGKVTPVAGTEEAFNKYLELQPNGPNAEPAKQMLSYIGSTVETSFGKQKKGSKK
jgi:tetratricopeptide (TPR) repeat protein